MGIFDKIISIGERAVNVVTDVIVDVISWIVPIPEIPDYGDNQTDLTNNGTLVNKFNANAHIPVVYCTRKVGGNFVFLETS